MWKKPCVRACACVCVCVRVRVFILYEGGALECEPHPTSSVQTPTRTEFPRESQEVEVVFTPRRKVMGFASPPPTPAS